LWRPSESRVITLDSFVPVPRGTTASPLAPLNWPAKDPNDILDYQLDVGPAIVGNEGDTIAAIDASVSPNNPGDLVVSGITADGTRAVFWMSGGQKSVVYTVTILITTSLGRTLQRSVLLPVMSLSTPIYPGTAIEIANGLILTDHAGNPVLATF